MKIFIDLGAYNGDTIEIAKKRFDDIDLLYGFEPCSDHFDLLQTKFTSEQNLILINAAADRVDRENKKLYYRIDRDNGHSLIKEKVNCSKVRYELVKVINFSKFIKENFSISDEILLKINIEGMEYKLLEDLIKEGAINYIDKIYCAWHYHKIGMPKEKHDLLIRKLKKLNFDVTGDDKYDNFVIIMNPQPVKLKL